MSEDCFKTNPALYTEVSLKHKNEFKIKSV